MSENTKYEREPISTVLSKRCPADGSPAGYRAESSDTQNSDEAQPHLHAKTFLAVFSVCLIYFAQDFALVGAGAQGPIIAGHFQSTALSWITAPITILTVVLGPIVSQAANYWGRKWFLVILTCCGAIGSLVVAKASSMPMVIAGFTTIGIGFGAQPLLHTVASEVLPRRLRSWAQAVVMISNSWGLLTGLVVGGALNRHGDPNGFRNHFYISLGLFALSAGLCILSYQPLPSQLQLTLSFKEKIGQLDSVGYALLGSSLVLFCVGLSWSQNPYPWSDPHVSATFAIGLALTLGLIIYEVRYKEDGMFHHGLFKANRNFTVSLICVFCEGVAFFAANIYFAFQVSMLYETDSLIIGIRFGIAFITTTFASLCAGVYCAITKKIRGITVFAFLIFTAFFVCMATTNADSSRAVWGYPILMGWALGMSLIALITVAQLSTPPYLISIASGLVISVRSLGGTIGIAIYNAVFISETKKLSSNIGAAVSAAGLPADSINSFVTNLLAQNRTTLSSISGVNSDIIGVGEDAFLDTYSKGFRNVWISALPFIVLATIASFFILDPSKEFNNHIDAPVEKREELYLE